MWATVNQSSVNCKQDGGLIALCQMVLPTGQLLPKCNYRHKIHLKTMFDRRLLFTKHK